MIFSAEQLKMILRLIGQYYNPDLDRERFLSDLKAIKYFFSYFKQFYTDFQSQFERVQTLFHIVMTELNQCNELNLNELLETKQRIYYRVYTENLSSYDFTIIDLVSLKELLRFSIPKNVNLEFEYNKKIRSLFPFYSFYQSAKYMGNNLSYKHVINNYSYNDSQFYDIPETPINPIIPIPVTPINPIIPIPVTPINPDNQTKKAETNKSLIYILIGALGFFLWSK